MKRILPLILICCSIPLNYTGEGIISTNWNHIYYENLRYDGIELEIENITRVDSGDIIKPYKILWEIVDFSIGQRYDIYNQSEIVVLKSTNNCVNFGFNLTVWVNHSYGICSIYLDVKSTDIYNSNVDFYRINDFLHIGEKFYHQNVYHPNDWEILERTRVDFDFSTSKSRRQVFISDIFLDLSITFPSTTVISYLILDRILTADKKQEEEIKKELEKIDKHNTTIEKELKELRQLLNNTNQNNAQRDD